VAVSNSTQAESFFPILSEADMPTMFFGATSPDILADETTFALTSPTGQLTAIPAALAEEEGVTAVTAVVIDVPAAVDAVRQSEGALTEAGLTLDVEAVAPGTADMTPQMQRVVSDNPDGVVTVIGNDAFCIAAFNGLRTAGFDGTVTSIPECITDATRTSVPGDFLEGIRLGATTPFEDKSDPSIVQYLAVLDEYGPAGADRESNNGAVAFTVISSLITAAQGVEGDITPASVLEAIRTMDEAEMLGTGGQTFQCNGQADPAGRAICSGSSVLVTALDSTGKPTTFTRLG
jgi:branched-chain amino acid transport system substrate-binding protein